MNPSLETYIVDPVLLATAEKVELGPEPIPQEWILTGAPVARAKKIVMSRDWTSSVVVWDCTAGTFHWHYGQDEAIIVVSGSAVLLQATGEERRIGPGDVGFFPAGTIAKWRVDDYIRKIAVLREPVWRPVGIGMKVWNKALRTAGLKRERAI